MYFDADDDTCVACLPSEVVGPVIEEIHMALERCCCKEAFDAAKKDAARKDAAAAASSHRAGDAAKKDAAEKDAAEKDAFQLQVFKQWAERNERHRGTRPTREEFFRNTAAAASSQCAGAAGRTRSRSASRAAAPKARTPQAYPADAYDSSLSGDELQEIDDEEFAWEEVAAEAAAAEAAEQAESELLRPAQSPNGDPNPPLRLATRAQLLGEVARRMGPC